MQTVLVEGLAEGELLVIESPSKIALADGSAISVDLKRVASTPRRRESTARESTARESTARSTPRGSILGTPTSPQIHYDDISDDSCKNCLIGDKPWLIDPTYSRFSRYWDITIVVLLCFTATVTPYEVAFLKPKIGPLFVVNRFVDTVFILDIIFSFFTAYYSLEDGRWVRDRKTIVKNYLSTWFLIDAVSSAPYDLFTINTENTSIGQLKVLRFLRLFKLAKLLRVLKAGRIFHRFEASTRIDYSSAEILKFFLLSLLGMHLLACGLAIIEDLQSDEVTWINSYFDGKSAHEIDAYTLYVACLYWSGMTVSSVGYGDIVAQTTNEQIYMIFCMLVGALGYGYIIGAVTIVLGSRDQRISAFHHTMDMLNEFMAFVHLADPLQRRLREFFKYVMLNADTSVYQRLLFGMSPNLRGEVAMATSSAWVDSVPFLQDCPEQLIIAMALVMEPHILPPTEMILSVGDVLKRLYVVNKGIVLAKGKVFLQGKVFGEESMMRGQRRSRFSAQTMTFVEAISIRREQFLRLIAPYPEVVKRLKWISLKHLLAEEVVAYAAAFRLVSLEMEAKRRSMSNDPRAGSLEIVKEDERDCSGLPPSPTSAAAVVNEGNRLNSVKSTVTGSALLFTPKVGLDSEHMVTDARVRHYAAKLRLYILVPSQTLSKKYHGGASRIQRAYRGYLLRRRHLIPARRGAIKHLQQKLHQHQDLEPFQKLVLLHLKNMQQNLSTLGLENNNYMTKMSSTMSVESKVPKNDDGDGPPDEQSILGDQLEDDGDLKVWSRDTYCKIGTMPVVDESNLDRNIKQVDDMAGGHGE